MQSLNQIKQILQNEQENHAVLSKGTFLFDDPPEWGAKDRIQYILTGWTIISASLDGNLHSFKLRGVIADLVHQDNKNKDDVSSDTHKWTLQYFSKIKYALEVGYDATVIINGDFEHFTGRFDDDVTGWEFEMHVQDFYDRNTCDTPDSGANAGKVLIKDQNGNIIATLNPNSTYTVTVWDGIEEGDSSTTYTDGITDD